MITREDVITVLKTHEGESQDQKRAAVQEYVDKNSMFPEDREKIMSDLESYEDF